MKPFRYFTICFIVTAASHFPPTLRAQACNQTDVLAVDQAWARAAFTKDLDGLMSHYSDEAVQLPPGGSAIEGKVALRALFASLFADSNYSLNWTAAKTAIAKSCDIAYSRGSYVINAVRDGKPMTLKGTYLAVWVRSRDGLWRVSEDIFN